MHTRTIIIGVLSVLALLGIAVGVYFYMELHSLKADPARMAQQEKEDLIARVSRLALTPSDEQPTVATVSDPNLLSAQVFFIDSMAGDKVLIYQNARKVFLYRPSIDKIISIAPVLQNSAFTAAKSNISAPLKPQTVTKSTKP